MGSRVANSISICFSLSLSLAGAEASDFIIERVARTGDPVPGVEGAVFTTCNYLPVIDGQGNVLTVACFDDGTGDRAAYFHGPPGDLTLFFEWKTPAPGYDDPDMIHQYLGFPAIAENGTIVLRTVVGKTGSSPATFVHSFYDGTPESMRLFVYEGGSAPDSPKGSTIFYYPYSDVYVNANGQVGLFPLVLELPGDPPTLVDAIIAGSPDDLKVIAQSYDEAPGIEGGATFVLGELPTIGGYSFSDAGWAAFGAQVEGPLVDSYNDFGFYAGTNDELHLVVREESQAPGLDSGVVFDAFLWDTIHMNAAGEAVFIGYVEGPGIDSSNNAGVWSGAWESPTLVTSLREGTQAPGTSDGTVIDLFQSATLDNSSRLLVQAYLTGPKVDSGNDEGWWYGPADDVQLLLRDGQQAPGLPEGVMIDFNVTMDYLYSALIASNDNGDLVMLSPLSGPGVDTSNNAALFYRLASAKEWLLLFRTGDLLDGFTIAPAGLDSYSLFFTNGAHGYGRSLNSAGQFVIYIEFDDGSTGIYRIRPIPIRSPMGDADDDGDIDLIDFAVLQTCFNSIGTQCYQDFDFDFNGVVDLVDYNAFQDNYTGPR